MPALSSPTPPAAAAWSCRAYAASAASSCRVTRSACTSISPARSIRWRTRSTSRSSATDASELASTADTSPTSASTSVRTALACSRTRPTSRATCGAAAASAALDSSTAASTSAARSCSFVSSTESRMSTGSVEAASAASDALSHCLASKDGAPNSAVVSSEDMGVLAQFASLAQLSAALAQFCAARETSSRRRGRGAARPRVGLVPRLRHPRARRREPR